MTHTLKVFKLLTEKFFARLERKTGWGKEEVKREYNEAATEATMEVLDLIEDSTEVKL